MLSRTHDIGAFASLLTIATYYPPTDLSMTTIIVALIVNIVGALLPDLDQSSNRLWDLLPGGNFVGKIMSNVFLGHRSISHSLLGVFLVWKINIWLLPKILNPNFVDQNIVFLSLMIGYISHLLMDGLTEEGLPLLFPLKIKFGFPPIKQWRIETGKWFEKWIIIPSIVIYIFYFTINNWQKISAWL